MEGKENVKDIRGFYKYTFCWMQFREESEKYPAEFKVVTTLKKEFDSKKYVTDMNKSKGKSADRTKMININELH